MLCLFQVYCFCNLYLDRGKDGQYHNAYESYIVAKDLVYKNEENRRFLGDVLLRYAEIYDFGIYAPMDKKKAVRYYAEAERILKKQAENRNGFAMRALQRMEEDKKREKGKVVLTYNAKSRKNGINNIEFNTQLKINLY